MYSDKKYRRYFATQMRGGKSPVAAVIDFILLRLTILLTTYVWFLWQVNNPVISGFLAGLTTVFFSVALFIYDSVKLDKYIAKSTLTLQKKALLEHLMLMSNDQMRDLLQSALELKKPSRCFDVIVSQDVLYAVIQLHPSEKVTPSMLLKYYQGAKKCKCDTLKLFTTAKFGIEAQEIAQRMDINAVLYESDSLIEMAKSQGLLPGQETVDAIIGAQIQRRQAIKKRYKNAFAPENAKRYITLAGIIMLASAITGHWIYYAACAAVCLALAGVCYYNAKKPRPTVPA